MREAYTEDQVLPFPKSRRFLEAAMRSTHHKPMIHGLLEVDVTRARALLRGHHDRTGESLSFTAFAITCLARAVDENKAVHALRKGRARVVLFADVDVLTWVEREAGDQRFIVPYIVRAANRKTLDAVHGEIRTARTQDLSRTEGGGATALRRLPAWLYPAYFWVATRVGRWSPRQWKKNWGTVTLSAVGMFGDGGGWGIPPSTPSLCWITLGGIGRRRADADGPLTTREYLSLTVSFDHDMIDGAPAARFTGRLKELIESGHGLPDAVQSSVTYRAAGQAAGVPVTT
jgi:pyruvate/2-oxoglutarate dehydrogenase complex dihydrolipoamide acyltransferase (E2) component